MFVYFDICYYVIIGTNSTTECFFNVFLLDHTRWYLTVAGWIV